jgi:hypothetical protein
MSDPVYWLSPVGERDDFGRLYGGVMYDAATTAGSWACMSEISWIMHRRYTTLGMGLGQRFEKQGDGRWLKTEG